MNKNVKYSLSILFLIFMALFYFIFVVKIGEAILGLISFLVLIVLVIWSEFKEDGKKK